MTTPEDSPTPSTGVLDAEVPAFGVPEAERALADVYGVAGHVTSLRSERDRNFFVTADDQRWVLKVSGVVETDATLDMENQAMAWFARQTEDLRVPALHPTVDGQPVTEVVGTDGRTHQARLITVVAGSASDEVELLDGFDEELGRACAQAARAMYGFAHPAAIRDLEWDPRRVHTLAGRLDRLAPDLRALVAAVLDGLGDLPARAAGLPAGTFHGDITLSNVMTVDGRTVEGVIDFGDLHHTARVADLAIALTSLLRVREDPYAATIEFLRGYQRVQPLEEGEVEVLGDLVLARLAASLLITATLVSGDADHAATAAAMADGSVRALTRLWSERDRYDVAIARATGLARGRSTTEPAHDLHERRQRSMGGTLSPLFYDRPLHIVRGEGVWLYDADGTAYLDSYNNVPVLGHAHPAVARAIATQQQRLNVNSRYLHANTVELAERLVATMPPGLDTVVFMSSGSEANDLAWRLATHYTGRTGALVSDSSYHGVSTVTARQSSNTWRNGYRSDGIATYPAPAPIPASDGMLRRPGREDATDRVRAGVGDLAEQGHELALALADPLFTSGGILDASAGFVAGLADAVHAAGGLFLADEVQAGFGRSGRHLWSFAGMGFTPDFVSLGKPMGNGHPIAALITRRDIVDTFLACDEYFSTFGGNPVSAAAALTVLDIIEDENLIARSATVGDHLRSEIADMADHIGVDVRTRGSGLIAGIEVVRDGPTRPVIDIVEAMKARRVLMSNTGPRGDVLKVRPPLVLAERHADHLVSALRDVLTGRDT